MPIFQGGAFVIKGHDGKQFELTEQTWRHIVQDNSSKYLEAHFDKIAETLEHPDFILKSPKEESVKAFVKFFDDFYILNTVTARVFLYVLVNVNNCRIRTVYTNSALKGWEQEWKKK